MKKVFICLLALLILTVLCACGDTDGTTNFTLPPLQTTDTTPPVEITDTTASTPEATLPLDGSETANMRRALLSAGGYLAEMPFSREGLINILTKYENVNAAEAAYGADNCGADWNAEAVRMAERLVPTSVYSRVSLEAQLKHEGFTKEEASFGIQNAEVDWLTEAAEVVEQQKGYNPSMTEDALAKYLTAEGFTMAEIGQVLAKNK